MSYVALATTTLGTATATVTFSSIPATYRDLIVIATGRSNRASAADLYLIRLNGSSTGYSRVWMYGDGSTFNSFSDASLNELRPYALAGATAASGRFGFLRMQIMDYMATDKHKTVLIDEDAAQGNDVGRATYRWANTAAVNQISVSPLLGTQLAIGTTISLYGIAG